MHTDDTGQQGGDSAGNGLLSRRQWMQIGAGTAAAAVGAVVAKSRLGGSPGAAVPERRHRTMAIAQVCRRCVVSKSRFILWPQAGASSRLQLLSSTITPMHCTLCATSGIPEIDPRPQTDRHGLTLATHLDYDALPLSHAEPGAVFECSQQLSQRFGAIDERQEAHGLISGAEWTGVPCIIC